MEVAIKTLLGTCNEALIAFTRRDLLGEEVDIEELWTLPRVKRILKNQYKTMAELVEFYGLNKKHDTIRNAAEYLFSFQTKEGEFRGMYGNQYSPNYSASITEFLIKAG
jgi:hypothetical protein